MQPSYLSQSTTVFQDDISPEQWAMLLFHKQEQEHHHFQAPLSPPQEDFYMTFTQLMANSETTPVWDAYPWESTTTHSSPNMVASTVDTVPFFHQASSELVPVALTPPPMNTVSLETSPIVPSYYITPNPNTGGFYMNHSVHAPPSPPLSTSPLEDLDMLMVKLEDGEQKEQQQTQQKQEQEQEQQEQQKKCTTSSCKSTICTSGNASITYRTRGYNKGQGRKTKQNKHNGVYQCDTCSKVFTRPYNLKSHSRTHTKERPFICGYEGCEWKFARPHDLKRHELLHSGIKPHSCPHCDKRFARRDALRRHWKVEIECGEAAERLSITHATVGRRRVKDSLKGQQQHKKEI